MTQKHTPLPWKLDYSGELDRTILDQDDNRIVETHGPCEEAEANAAFIVRACNSHYQLLEALKWALPYVERLRDGEITRAAIAKAEAQ